MSKIICFAAMSLGQNIDITNIHRILKVLAEDKRKKRNIRVERIKIRRISSVSIFMRPAGNKIQ